MTSALNLPDLREPWELDDKPAKHPGHETPRGIMTGAPLGAADYANAFGDPTRT